MDCPKCGSENTEKYIGKGDFSLEGLINSNPIVRGANAALQLLEGHLNPSVQYECNDCGRYFIKCGYCDRLKKIKTTYDDTQKYTCKHCNHTTIVAVRYNAITDFLREKRKKRL